jgi:hypothetical protein
MKAGEGPGHRHLACDAVMPPEVRPVGDRLVVDLDDPVVEFGGREGVAGGGAQAVRRARDVRDAFDLGGRDGEAFRKVAGIQVGGEVDEFLQPVQREEHGEKG